jgi:2-polyprenyl-6-hydroxyphenyl methylase/3-demethylubiquinone-9 3-methyltransferase
MIRVWAEETGRRLSLLPHKSESWTIAKWNHSYASGQLTYFSALDELARYSILVGYLSFFSGEPTIIDVGCGSGLLRQRLDNESFCHYTGIDLSTEAIRSAGYLADERTSFVCGDFLDFEGSKADIVVLNEVLYFVPSVTQMLDKVESCLSDGGMLLTSMWRHPGDRSLWRLLDRRFEALDAVRVRNESSRLARKGWRISCHRKSGLTTTSKRRKALRQRNETKPAVTQALHQLRQGADSRRAIKSLGCQGTLDGVMQQNHVARPGQPCCGADALSSGTRFPVKGINGP